MKSIFTIKTTVLTLIILAVIHMAQAQVVVIDPGHGYSATGTNPDGRSATEHATALAVGLKLKDQIENSCSNWTVHMTRSTANGWISLSQRKTMSNSWGADRFISIHCNAGGGSGTETFWCNRSTSLDADNSAFSREIQDRMVDKGSWSDRRSVEDDSYIFHLAVLNGNNAIGVLNEIGFVDTSDETKLLSDSWRDLFAEAYLLGLQNSIGGTCTPSGVDTVAPTTSISATGGTTQSGDFTANFTDTDNVGVTRQFYQTLEKYGAMWYANRNNGFFNDHFEETYTGYTYGTGTWTATGGKMIQSDVVADNTKLSSYLSQTSGLPYLYEFSAKVVSTSGPRKFGIHIMADDATLSQRGNSYLIWFSGNDDKVRIYETVSNALYTRATVDLPQDNNWANYKITYSPAYGVIEVFKDNVSVATWTDSTPLSTGNSISLRTNATEVEFDDLTVYKFRSGSSQLITAGTASTDDIRTASAKVRSLVRDDAGNWSTTGSLDMTLTFPGARTMLEPEVPSQNPSLSAMILYPNPTDGQSLMMEYHASSKAKTSIELVDQVGRTLGTIYDSPTELGNRRVDISEVMSQKVSGIYWVRVTHGSESYTTKIIMK
ncbi:N-acetylmuramoyl-L-alanine amidase [Reichenbachiella sp. MSK19-1]|uniref:N-acetylmuramoyl-L-alanine amidase n=1 Tax=Reichenbachiella sp. MSK19-1 TaxID=1897631 RepID=UPI000E6BD066|nr:N-acetylmuramoyl-L-alanine amidase [Reichenbachiella sp. MSK19-1]